MVSVLYFVTYHVSIFFDFGVICNVYILYVVLILVIVCCRMLFIASLSFLFRVVLLRSFKVMDSMLVTMSWVTRVQFH